MDIYNLINSKAIREHCRKIGHQFNPEELAVLIFRNRSMSVDEKIKLYEELISDYPDMEVIERVNCKHYDSVKTMIGNEINRLQDLTKNIETSEHDYIYTYMPFYISSQRFYANDKFKNISKTYQEVTNKVNKEIQADNDISMYKIIKKSLSDEFKEIIAEYVIKNKESKLINLYDSDNDWLDIDNIFLNIPTPFKKGDLLISYSKTPFNIGTIALDKGYPFVLHWLCTETENLKELMAKGNFDSSDMQGLGYFIRNDGTVIMDNNHDYDSWEYCKEEDLQGNERFLIAVSNLMKNEISIDLLLQAYDKIINQKQDHLDIFTEEGLELAGFNLKEINNIKNK